ncbi:uncharacterized protein LOC114353440 [Ostrinia furnacalis]|uniref:uncharacterized protein LOC114353440 n=1 Tax=Ostrinia furnacalis TaxID=93504 RepID=UPI00103CC231|nr:uncharacterized protein LOC114353440 [Ostrinia furnacalis]
MCLKKNKIVEINDQNIDNNNKANSLKSATVRNGRFFGNMTNYIKYIVFLLISVKAELRIYISDSPIQRIGARIYKKELLTDKYSSPKELAYDSSSRNLFFMYMDDVIQDSGRAYVNVVTKQTGKIKGITKNKATAVDLDSGDVYFGSEDGLYKYDAINKEANSIGLYNLNIMKLVVKNNEMYLLDGNDHMIYKVFNQGTTAVKIGGVTTVMEFDVDYQRNVHFVTMCGLFCAVKGQEVVKNTVLSLVYNFIIDEGKTFGLNDEGLHEINCVNGTARKVAELDFVPRSIVFGDYGDIFYAVDDSIYRLRPVHSYQVYKLHRKTT